MHMRADSRGWLFEMWRSLRLRWYCWHMTQPNPKNPRRITDKKLAMLKRSLETFGDLGGIVVNESSQQIVGGHQRVKALLGCDHIPEGAVRISKRFSEPTRTGTIAEGHIVAVGTHMSSERYPYRVVRWDENRERLANLAANKNAGEFDLAGVGDWLGDLEAGDFDLDLTMFDAEDREALASGEDRVHVSAHDRTLGESEDDSFDEDTYAAEPDDDGAEQVGLGPLAEGLPAPFPWFGGKRKVAGIVWQRFGNVRNYVEPFFGSGAVLLRRPEGFVGNETVNDLDGYVANFWRATKHDPEGVAEYADNPVNENDLHARHVWLLQRRETLQKSLEGDPDYYDAKIAGYWVWGISCWIGSGFCSGKGPWQVNESGQLVHLGDNGRGVNRKLVHLGNNGRGVNRQLVHLGDNGRGVNSGRDLTPWFKALAARLARVRVCSGDWLRVCGPSVTFKHGLTGVFLDPPYADTAERQSDLYREDSESVAHTVREWAIENGENELLRIALCGYEGEHKMPKNWSVCEWNAGSGFGGQATDRTGNGKRERIWFSPACETLAPSLVPSRANHG